ncbi:MAG: DUF2752 domain-containing protein [Candidatus Brocadiia bacterium]
MSEPRNGQKSQDSRERAQAPERFRNRNLQVGVLLGCILFLIFGGALKPDPIGLGTHTHFGTKACSFLKLTKIPCPLCGTTTSLAFLLDGQIEEAWQTHHMGVAIGFLMMVLIPFSMLSWFFDINWLKPLERITWVGWAGGIGGLFGFFCWGGKHA